MELTSATPRIERSIGRTTQSWIVRRSISSSKVSARLPSSGCSIVYWYTSPKPVDTGPSTGVMPGSSLGDTSISRSITSWRAKNTSVWSVNTSVISDNPLLFMERISTSPGRPVIAISTGTVISRSTSSGLRPTATVATCTCMLVTSGKASTERFFAAKCRRAQGKRDHHHQQALPEHRADDCGKHGLLQFRELALVVQVKGAIQHNALLDSESAHHRAHIGDFGAQLDGNAQEPIIALSYERRSPGWPLAPLRSPERPGSYAALSVMCMLASMSGLSLRWGFSTMVRTITVRVIGSTVSATNMISPSKLMSPSAGT